MSSSQSRWDTCCSATDSWVASCMPRNGWNPVVGDPQDHNCLFFGALALFYFCWTWFFCLFIYLFMYLFWRLPSPGLMFPSSADIHLAPFSDEQLYSEHYARASFWSYIHKHTHTHSHTIINPCMRTQTHWLPVSVARPVSCQLQTPPTPRTRFTFTSKSCSKGIVKGNDLTVGHNKILNSNWVQRCCSYSSSTWDDTFF